MIDQALYEYLTSPSDLDGHAAEPFATPLKHGSSILQNRNDVRRLLRDTLGKRIYAGRNLTLPNEGHTAATIQVLTSDNTSHLRGEGPTDQTMLQIDTWATHGNAAALRAYRAGTLIRHAIASFIGPWGTTHPIHVYSCTRERANTVTAPPNDGSEYWEHRFSQDFIVNHDAEVVTYAGTELNAVSSVAFNGSVLFLAVDGATVIPEGRTLETVEWVADDGSTQVILRGAANAFVSEANSTGVYQDAQLNAVAAGLSGTTQVTMTIADSTGRISQSTESIDI